jgi:hypothetical protein
MHTTTAESAPTRPAPAGRVALYRRCTRVSSGSSPGCPRRGQRTPRGQEVRSARRGVKVSRPAPACLANAPYSDTYGKSLRRPLRSVARLLRFAEGLGCLEQLDLPSWCAPQITVTVGTPQPVEKARGRPPLPFRFAPCPPPAFLLRSNHRPEGAFREVKSALCRSRRRQPPRAISRSSLPETCRRLPPPLQPE